MFLGGPYSCDFDSNPCRSKYNIDTFGYYYPHINPYNYVQCGIWNPDSQFAFCTVVTCPNNQTWNQRYSTCGKSMYLDQNLTHVYFTLWTSMMNKTFYLSVGLVNEVSQVILVMHQPSKLLLRHKPHCFQQAFLSYQIRLMPMANIDNFKAQHETSQKQTQEM